MTLGWILALLTAHVALLDSGIFVDYQSQVLTWHWVYLNPGDIWSGGYWSLLTAAFVHASPIPLGGEISRIGSLVVVDKGRVVGIVLLLNMLALWMFGRRVEGALGPSELFGLLFFGALVSSAAGLASGFWPTFGASGMICSLIGAMHAGRKRHFLFAEIFLVRDHARFVLLWLLSTLAASAAGWIPISNLSHLAGWFFGFCAGHVFLVRRPRPSAAMGLAAIAAMAVVSIFWAPWNPQWLVWNFTKQAKTVNFQKAFDQLRPLLENDSPDPMPLNAAAWVLATSTNDAARDGKRAVELARQACALTDWRFPDLIDTLAAAFAETGEWEKAESTENLALMVAREQETDPEIMSIFEQNMKTLLRRQKIRE